MTPQPESDLHDDSGWWEGITEDHVICGLELLYGLTDDRWYFLGKETTPVIVLAAMLNDGWMPSA
jgi:hypothetical protein